jgi:hypothetical protein
MTRRSNDQTMKEAIESMLKTFKLDDKMKQVKLVDSWEKVMGPAVARRTVDIKIFERKLFVSLNSASLRQELFQERDRIKSLLNEEVGGEVITEVVFR